MKLKKPSKKKAAELHREFEAMWRKVTSLTEADLQDDFSTINLVRLCALHEGYKKTGNHGWILEEIFALCTNADFIKTVSGARSALSEHTGYPLPTKERDVVKDIRTSLYVSKKKAGEENKWEWYQKLLKSIRERHGLYGEAYNTGDPFDQHNLESRVEQMQDLVKANISELKGVSTEKQINARAKQWAVDAALDGTNFLSALENIIFYNDPLYNFELGTGFPHANRSGRLKFQTDWSTGEPYIEGKFYLNSTKEDMLKVIERDYDEIARKRKERYSIPAKKDSRKQDLMQKYRVFQLKKQGFNDARIAGVLEDEFGGETTPDNIRVLRKRIQEEGERFNARRTG